MKTLFALSSVIVFFFLLTSPLTSALANDSPLDPQKINFDGQALPANSVANTLVPQDTRPPSPSDYCNNTSGAKQGPFNPPTPFFYQPFTTDQPFAQIWTSQMDHASPNYTRDGVVATLGEKLRYDDHHPAYPGDPRSPLLAGTKAWNKNGTGPTFFDYTVLPMSKENLGYKLFYYESASIETYVGYDGHDGHDFAVTGNALAAAAGTVAMAGDSGTPFGRVVQIYHPEGYLTFYAHLASIPVTVTKGLSVVAGQPIGVIGGSGRDPGGPLDDHKWGVHLHFNTYRWNTTKQGWQITDPFGWDPWSGTIYQDKDPLVSCNGEVSYNLWFGWWPQPKTASRAPSGDHPAYDRYIGGLWEDNAPPPFSLVDNATFISDVTLPDGTVVSPGQSLTKTWRVRNSGTSTWNGFKLIFLQGDQMGGTSPVNIPTTSPGQEVNITVSLQAPNTSGNKVGYWQIVNKDGVHVPGGKLSVNVNVIGSGSAHIAAFSASPASPSNASSVRFYARVNWWAPFRAMRVKVDGQVIGETATTEYTFSWNTSSVTSGDHSVVLEVADQTDTSWSRPERQSMIYNFQGSPAPANHAPNRPTPSSPYDWYVYYTGNTAQLCAQANGDPDGDSIAGYYFDVYESAQLWNSGWVGSNCVTTGALGPYDYKWRVKVRDSRGAESEWSDSWHFTLVNPSLSISEMYFQPQDGNSEQVKIRVCTTGQGGIGITLRVSVNDANDGSGNGQWHIIKELGVPCFNDIDAPVWDTLEYGDGPHRVRAEAHGTNTGWNGATVREETYTLPHRRPASTRLLAPMPPSGEIGEAVYLNSRTVDFKWQTTLRANNYTLHIATSPSPKDSSTPVFRQTFANSVTQTTVNFSQDYPTLYWQVTTTNDMGSNASGAQLFGIDRTAPSCTVQTLPAVTYESIFQVSWGGTDNLAGIRSFDIQYMDSGRGEWADWALGIPVSKIYDLFTGQPGHTYSFRCRATDNAGNTGTYPSTANTSIKVDPAARPQTPWWNTSYTGKRNITVLNNMPSVTLPVGYPVRVHFDAGTTPTAAELYNASQSSPKCNDLRIVYNDTTELNRIVQNCSSSLIDIWFRTRVSVAGGTSNNTAHQLYYGNASTGAPPADPNQVWYPYREGDTAYLYFLQEGVGSTAYDSSGNGRNCSINSSVQWATSKFGNGLRFNRANGGDSRSLSCGSAAALSSFTIDFWYKPDSDDGGRIAGELSGGGNGGGGNNWLLQNFEGRMRFDVWPCSYCGSSEVRSNFNLRDAPYAGNWNHIAVTFNGGNEVKFYINGSFDSTQYLSQNGVNTFSPPVEIGSVEGISQIKANLGALRISSGVKSNFSYGTFAAITNEPTTATGSPIAPPITGTPDLAVLNLTNYPNASGGVLVQAIVQNQGNRDTQDGFYIDLYANHQPTGAGDYSNIGRFWVANPISAGATVTVTTVLTNTTGLSGVRRVKLAATTETTSTLYIQADSSGALNETTKSNNISGGAQVCTASADSYESDNSAANAKTITVGTTQSHNFDAAGDQDWVKFTAQTGAPYTIQTSNLGPNADTYSYLYGTDGSTLLASNDDYGGTLASRIDWTAPASGTYYVMVKHWNPNVGGCGTSYDLSITLAVGSNPLYLPLITK